MVQAPWEGQDAGLKRMMHDLSGDPDKGTYDYYDPEFYEQGDSEDNPYSPFSGMGESPFLANKGMKMRKRYAHGGQYSNKKKRYTQGGRF